MSNKRNNCLNLDGLAADIKTKILLKAGVRKEDISNPESINLLTDEQVMSAIKTLEEKNLRDQLDQSNNLIKLNQISSALDEYKSVFIENYKKRKKGKEPSKAKMDEMVNDYILSKLDRDIMMSFGADGGLTTTSYAQIFKNDAGNILKQVADFYYGIKGSERIELEQAIVRLMDGRDGENNSRTITSQKVLDTYQDVYRQLKEWEDRKINLLRKSGMYLDPREDFYFKQSHDSIKMAQAGFDTWYNSVKDKIDPDRSLTPDGDSASTIGVEDYLRRFYDSVVYGDDLKSNPFQMGRNGNETLKNKFNQQRLLQFQSATDALAYKREFSHKESFIEDMFSSINKDADMFGLASTLGTNPERNLQILQNYFEVPENYRQRQEGVLSFLLGNSSYTNNGAFYNAYRFLKGFVYSKIMGGTVITSYFGDGAAMAKTFKAMGFHNNLPYIFSGMKDFSSIAYKMTMSKSNSSRAQKILNNPELKTIEERNMTSLEGIISNESVQHRFGDDFAEHNYRTSKGDDVDTLKRKQMYSKVGNAGSWLANTTFKYTGQTRLQRIMKDYAQSVALNNIDVYRKFSFEQLRTENNNLYSALRQYAGIDEADWNNIRNLEGELTGASLRDLSNINYDTAAKVHKFMLEAQALSVQEASVRVKSKGLQAGSNKDNPMRMIFDSVLMLKSFLMQAVPNIVNRYNFKHKQALANGRSNEAAILSGLTESMTLVASTTAAAYMIFATRALLSGTTPIDPAVLFEGNEDGFGMSQRQTQGWGSLLAMGGGLGILGDILLYDSSIYGKSTSDIMIGPSADQVGSMLDYSKDLMSGDATVYGTINSLDRNLPFQNVWYLRELRRRLLTETLLETIDEERYNDSIETRKRMLEEKGNQRFFIDYRRN